MLVHYLMQLINILKMTQLLDFPDEILLFIIQIACEFYQSESENYKTKKVLMDLCRRTRRLIKGCIEIKYFCSKTPNIYLWAGSKYFDLSNYQCARNVDIKALAGVQTINLTRCTKVTDAGIKALAGVQTINLSECTQVTDAGVKALAGVQTIDLSWCTQVTDAGVKALVGARVYR